MKKQFGFSFVDLLLVIAIVGLVSGLGYVGWRTYSNQNKPSDQASTSSEAAQERVLLIKNEGDLQAINAELESLSFDDEDANSAIEKASF